MDWRSPLDSSLTKQTCHIDPHKAGCIHSLAALYGVCFQLINLNQKQKSTVSMGYKLLHVKSHSVKNTLAKSDGVFKSSFRPIQESLIGWNWLTGNIYCSTLLSSLIRSSAFEYKSSITAHFNFVSCPSFFFLCEPGQS